jgi:hypothetical protein
MSDKIKRPNPAVNDVFDDRQPESRSGANAAEVAAEADEQDLWLRENVPPHHR